MGKMNFERWLRILSDAKENFEVIVSANSQIISMSDGESKFKKKTVFNDNAMNPAVFAVSKLLKSETEEWLINNDRFNDVKSRGQIKYFNYNYSLPDKLDKFYFVDISAAYITALKNYGVISENVFNKINELPKQDRLISLGILAYEPFINIYRAGKKVDTIRRKNEYAPVFYTACAIVESVISECVDLMRENIPDWYGASGKAGNDFLFYWVDGIFFRDKKYCEIIVNHLSKLGFLARSGECYDWKCEKMETHFDISFKQNDKGEIEEKEYNLPFHFQQQRERMDNFKLLTEEKYHELLLNLKAQKYGIKK